MQFLRLFVAFSAVVASVSALPSMDTLDVRRIRDLADTQRDILAAIKYSRRADAADAKPKLMPDPSDKEHQFQAPGKTDQRGPCPGMNTLANHGYIPRNGIATMAQLISGQMELYNLDFTLAAALALVAVALDGDLVTTKVSIGGKDDRTLALGALQNLISDEPGLAGHNHFESDSSLTRADYYLNNADDYTFQPDLYAKMQTYVKKYGKDGKYYDINALGHYRAYRYNISRSTNEKFVFGPPSILMYGAASFIYESFANATEGVGFASESVVNSFFGAVPDKSAPHGFRHVPERIPPNWYRRADQYDFKKVAGQTGAMAAIAPIEFGYRTAGDGPNHGIFINTTNPLTGLAGAPTTAEGLASLCCTITQASFAAIPGTISTGPRVLRSQLGWLVGALNPLLKDQCDCGNLSEPTTLGTDKPNGDKQDDLLAAILPKPGADAQAAGSKALHDAAKSLGLLNLL